MFALRGGGETPPRPYFRQSVIRKSHRRGVSALRDSFAGPRLGFAERSAAPTESRPSFASLREGRGRRVGGGRAGWGPRCSETANAWPSGSPAAAAAERVGRLPRQPWIRRVARPVQCEQQPGAPWLLSMPSAGPRAASGFQNEIPLLRVLAVASRGAGATTGGFLGPRLGECVKTLGSEMGWGGFR